MATTTDWKSYLQALKGRTITGYATTAMNGQVTSAMITFDDGSWVTFSVPPVAVWDGGYIEVTPGSVEER